MRHFTSRDYHEDPGAVEAAALQEPVAITEQGRPRLVLLNADEYARLKSRDRQVIDVHELPHDLAMSLLEPITDPDQIALNHLLD